jgi:hypothetical protein
VAIYGNELYGGVPYGDAAVQTAGWRRPQIPTSPVPPHHPVSPKIPFYVQVEPTVDNRAVIAVLYAAGAIDEEQFAALIAV